jgi:hypothetical protein
MSLTAVVVITILNSALTVLLADIYRRKTYRSKWKYQLIALMGAVFVIELSMLIIKLLEVT